MPRVSTQSWTLNFIIFPMTKDTRSLFPGQNTLWHFLSSLRMSGLMFSARSVHYCTPGSLSHADVMHNDNPRQCFQKQSIKRTAAYVLHSPIYTIDVDDSKHFTESDDQQRDGASKVVKKSQPVVSRTRGKYEPERKRYYASQTWKKAR